MFTGIVEEVGTVVSCRNEGGNRHIVVRARMAPELRIDQSIAHNGACLTVIAVAGDTYTVTAVEETLRRSNLGDLEPGDGVDLERSLRAGDRLDGHLVQGHIDAVIECLDIQEEGGSWRCTFRLPMDRRHLVVSKGSICLNGVSLTIADLGADHFTVAIIPYTYGHTIFRDMKVGGRVNVEFDILGKYVAAAMQHPVRV
ncbi:MAG: riboflavin synthase [Flavobacteriales bacterium]|nr:riboflavin synthase [Flavobacteriales bacterium]MCB9166979.1 riboflavin synthase [Flavobacteriales bacterium]